MSFPVILTSSNYVNDSTYRYQFPTSVDLTEYDVALGSMTMYYSWYSISAALNNNFFSISIPRSGGTDTLNITIPDGSYQISDLNNLIQARLIAGGYYLVNTASQTNLYYCNLQISPTAYAVQWITYPLPTSLPASYTSGGMTFPASANQHYQITITGTNQFKDIIGFNAGTYPSSATNVGTQTKQSDYIPQVSPISCVQMRLSCLYNPLSANTGLLYTFTSQGARVGDSINVSPPFESLVPCIGAHKEITVQFFDQLGRVLPILDRSLTIKLNFRKRSGSNIVQV